MMKHNHLAGKRFLSLLLVSALAFACAIPAAAVEPFGSGVMPTYDEAYYAMLDYYGNLTEGSVVKATHSMAQTALQTTVTTIQSII